MPFSYSNRVAVVGAFVILGLLGPGCSTSKSKDSDNSLNALVVSAGAITPNFNSSTDAYRLTVANTVVSTTVTATAAKPTASITVLGAAVTSGQPSTAIALTTGANVIPVEVIAENGARRTTTITVTRLLNSDASLASLAISRGILTPAQSSSVHAYTMDLYSGQTSITVTPTPTHPLATVQVNGVAVARGAASEPIALAVGSTDITVDVTAEDGTLSRNTIAVRELAPTTPVTVLDSGNGTPVKSALLTVMSPSGDVLEDAIPVDASGTAMLSLDPLVKYSLFAKGTGTAQDSLVNFDPSRETRADLYCHELGMTAFPASAPQITEVSYSSDGVSWTPIVGNQFTDVLANIVYLKVVAIGRSGVAPTAWSGFGIGVNFDRKAWSYDYFAPLETEENSIPVTVNGLPFYRTTSIFPLDYYTNTVAGALHSIDLVAYDVANNRTEQKVYFTVTDAVPVAADPDISAVTPTSVFNVLYTYGLTRDIFSVTPVDDKAITYMPLVQFNVGSGATAPGIRGFELYRSADGVNYTKVRTQQYGYLNRGSNGIYSCNDLDPTLKEGVVYSYKVRAFNGNLTANDGFTPESAPVSSQFLPPFTVGLSSPAMSAITTTRQPKFEFTVSNPALWDPAVSDYFYFFLFIRDKTGSEIFKQAYRYNFIKDTFQKAVASVWVDTTTDCAVSADHTTVSINFPNATTLQPGLTYEWSIFGTKGSASYSTSDASYFQRYEPGTNSYGRATSYGSTYEKSYGAINGFFTLTLDPSAQ